MMSEHVFITGCSSGIGRALALEFHREGCKVLATARSLESLSELAEMGIATAELDVTKGESITKAIKHARKSIGRIDMLVNNAGISEYNPLMDENLDLMRAVFETNVIGPLALIKEIAGEMAARRRGKIVNIGSVVGVTPTPFAGTYCASKAAVHAMSEVLRMELAPFDVQVIVVQPGGVRSNISSNAKEKASELPKGSLYQSIAAGIASRADLSQTNPTSAETFASEMVSAVLEDRPASVLRIGHGSLLLPALGKMPQPIRDAVMARKFGLSKLK